MASRCRYLATGTSYACSTTASATGAGTPFARLSQTSMLRLGSSSRGISTSASSLALTRGTSGSCAFLLGPAASGWRRSGRSSATVLHWPSVGSAHSVGRLRASEAAGPACGRFYATGGNDNLKLATVEDIDKEAGPKKTLVGRAVHTTKRAVAFIKEGIHHYWLGSKLLALNVRTAFGITMRLKNGHTLTRRERQHMIKTTADLFRLVPFAVFVIVPFMEFLLPIALKIFPNMLPSTFQDTMKKEEDMRKQLLLKLKMASFLQDTLQEMAETGETHAQIPKEEFLDFMKRVRGGGEVSGEEVLKFAKLFKDDFTIMNLSRAQLSSICKFLNLRPYGTDAFMRWQISRRVSKLREDDTMIAEEGVKSLTFEELQQACIARGMPATGLSKVALREQLEEWLDSSLNEQLPAVILILSRALSLTTASQKVDAALRETISTLPEDVVEEAELEMDLQKGTPSDRQLRLEVLRNTNEKLREELEKEAETFKEIEALESPGSVIPEEDAEHLRDVTEALSVLASPVSAERKALEQLEAREALLARAKTLKEQEAAATAALEVVVKPTKTKTRSDRSKERLGQQLEDLLDGLRDELSATEQKLGDKMVLIDKDRDGVITTEEVALACSLLKDRPSDAEIRNVLRVLDADEDGVVSLEDVQKIKQKLEDLHLEELLLPAEEKETSK